MKTKEFVIEQAKKKIEQAKTSVNALSEDAKAAAIEAIKEMEAKVAELEATEETVNTDDLKKELIALLEEKVAALIEKQKEQEPMKESQNYLKSANAMSDFLNVCRTSRNAAAFSANWAAKLSENGVLIIQGTEEAYLPDAVRGAITDAWGKSEWVKRLKFVNAKRYAVRANIALDADDTNIRANGHVNGEQKKSQTLMLGAKVLEPKYLYKLIDIDNLTIFNDDNSLMQYIADECVRQWVNEVARCVLVGDGRSNQATPNTHVSSIEGIASEERIDIEGDGFVDVVKGKFTLENLVTLREKVREDAQDCVMFMSRHGLNLIRRFVFAEGGSTTYASAQEVADMIGVKEIICTDFLPSGSTTENKPLAICVDLNSYVLCGANQPAFKADEDIHTNVTTWRYENPIAGAMEGLKGAAVLAYGGQ